jgi:hypothetical protein
VIFIFKGKVSDPQVCNYPWLHCILLVKLGIFTKMYVVFNMDKYSGYVSKAREGCHTTTSCHNAGGQSKYVIKNLTLADCSMLYLFNLILFCFPLFHFISLCFHFHFLHRNTEKAFTSKVDTCPFKSSFDRPLVGMHSCSAVWFLLSTLFIVYCLVYQTTQCISLEDSHPHI